MTTAHDDEDIDALERLFLEQPLPRSVRLPYSALRTPSNSAKPRPRWALQALAGAAAAVLVVGIASSIRLHRNQPAGTPSAVASTSPLPACLGAASPAPNGCWQLLRTAAGPSPRYGAGMSRDPVSGRLVLFGGYDNQHGALGDTWEFDGTTWTDASAQVGSSPSVRFNAAMAVDPLSNRIVLFGGMAAPARSNAWKFLRDTWTFDGQHWVQITSRLAVSPPGRGLPTIAVDPLSNRLILFSGTAADTWRFDGTTWTNLTPSLAASPPARYDACMGVDPLSKRLILFGGHTSGSPFGDTWRFDGTTWTNLSDRLTASPSARYGCAAAVDPTTGRLVMFTGSDGHQDMNDVWEFDGGAWTKLVLPAGADPHVREYAAVAQDSPRRRIVVFGGAGGTGLLADTWALY